MISTDALREIAAMGLTAYYADPGKATILAAADELDRLRGENAKLKTLIDDLLMKSREHIAKMESHVASVAALEAENAELRAKLKIDDEQIDMGFETVERMAAEIERLRAIVEKLPKTADGVPVVPGMPVYHFDVRGRLEIGYVDNRMEIRHEPIRSGFECMRWVWWSTQAAAEAAKEKKP